MNICGFFRFENYVLQTHKTEIIFTQLQRHQAIDQNSL